MSDGRSIDVAVEGDRDEDDQTLVVHAQHRFSDDIVPEQRTSKFFKSQPRREHSAEPAQLLNEPAATEWGVVSREVRF